MKTGIELITAERKRQIEKEGWTPEHDAEHTDGSLALAAVCYAAPEQIYVMAKKARAVQFEARFNRPRWFRLVPPGYLRESYGPIPGGDGIQIVKHVWRNVAFVNMLLQ